ncbi:MAG: aminopeptidase P family N-terminal domain-containing protein [Proteobacteria bacterium]|nr:aminopeptidase P family N-terminal domain-containing protein [Pseudomonadota bacterium]
MTEIRPLILGTAGHIDHGKTLLIKALTGIDADRLPEEQRRGMTIDLGFAHMEVAGRRIGIVDVPGHERFIRNMVAGATGIDLVMLSVGSDLPYFTGYEAMPSERLTMLLVDRVSDPSLFVPQLEGPRVAPGPAQGRPRTGKCRAPWGPAHEARP